MTPGISEAELARRIAAHRAHPNNNEEAAQSIQMKGSTFKTWLHQWKRLSPPAPEPEQLPPEDLPFDERLETMKKRNALRIAHARAQ